MIQVEDGLSINLSILRRSSACQAFFGNFCEICRAPGGGLSAARLFVFFARGRSWSIPRLGDRGCPHNRYKHRKGLPDARSQASEHVVCKAFHHAHTRGDHSCWTASVRPDTNSGASFGTRAPKRVGRLPRCVYLSRSGYAVVGMFQDLRYFTKTSVGPYVDYRHVGGSGELFRIVTGVLGRPLSVVFRIWSFMRGIHCAAGFQYAVVVTLTQADAPATLSLAGAPRYQSCPVIPGYWAARARVGLIRSQA